MGQVLITGASGLIGKAAAEAMSARHDVVCMSRRDPGLGLPWIRGEFGSFEDLRQLDGRTIDAVVHLAAVTGGCLERDGILVNVEGTRCLMRYLADRGCRKFVLASSIAAVGIQDPGFRPQRVPIPDEHPCLDRDGYGLSKFLMEQIARYQARQNPAIDVIALRFAVVVADRELPPPRQPGPLGPWALAQIVVMALSDAVRALSAAVEAPVKPGVRILNCSAPRSWTAVPVADVLRNWWGRDVDLAPFERPGHEYDSVYDLAAVRRELGFVAGVLPG